MKDNYTLHYIEAWKSDRIQNAYIAVQKLKINIVKDVPEVKECFNKYWWVVNPELFKTILDNYIQSTGFDTISFSTLRAFFFELAVAVEQDRVDSKFIKQFLYPEAKYIWNVIYLYYKDSIVYGDMVKKVQANLFIYGY